MYITNDRFILQYAKAIGIKKKKKQETLISISLNVCPSMLVVVWSLKQFHMRRILKIHKITEIYNKAWRWKDTCYSCLHHIGPYITHTSCRHCMFLYIASYYFMLCGCAVCPLHNVVSLSA